MKKYDAIIIGWGKGGKTLANFLAGKSQKVAIIEKSNKMYGGTCINVGCIPSKSITNSTEILDKKQLENLNDRENFYTESINKKNKLISALREKNYEMLNVKETVDIYDGIGSFVSENIVNIKTETEDIQIEGDKIFINTGSTTIIPNIKGIKESKNILTSTSLMDTETLPKELVIIGAGYIGLEFASSYSKFGSKVTVIDTATEILKREEKEVADRVKTILENQGVKFILGASVEEIKDNENSSVVVAKVENNEILEISAEKVLVAVGRKANITELCLENAGVKTDERGNIIVNEKLETTTSNIWAMGDVKGGLQFTYISLDDFRIIKDNVYGNGQRSLNDRNVVPYTMFISTPFSRVGMTEKEAIEKGFNVKVGKLEAMAIPKGKIVGNSEGLLKVVVDANNDKILGATLLCNNSHEIINIIALAIKTEQPYQIIRDMIFTHPTMAEALNDLFGTVN